MEIGLKWHALSVDEAINKLGADVLRGLTAKEHRERIEKFSHMAGRFSTAIDVPPRLKPFDAFAGSERVNT